LTIACLSWQQAVKDGVYLRPEEGKETKLRSVEAEQRGSQREKVQDVLGHGLWC
jgi:hypothetical protein